MNLRVAFVALILCWATVVFGDDAPEKAIIAEWQARQEAIRSARFEVESSEKGLVLPILAGGRVLIPADDGTVLSKKSVFAFDGPKVSYRYDSSPKPESESPFHCRFDGEVMSDLAKSSSLPYGQGTIYPEKRFTEFTNANLWPVILTYRPFAPGFGIDAASLKVDPQKIRLQQYECTVVACEKKDVKYKFYVDEANDCAIRRIERLPSPQVDIEYSRTADQVIYPSSWTITFDNVRRHVKSTEVTKIELNPTIPANEFAALDFPEGTLVTDRRTGWVSWQRENGRLEHIRREPKKE